MTPQEINIAIAKVCGWIVSKTHDYTLYGLREIGTLQQFPTRCPAFIKDGALLDVQGLPDYFGDLNAMQEAEDRLDSNQWELWHRIVAEWETPLARLIAAQRAEAFLRTLGLWKDVR